MVGEDLYPASQKKRISGTAENENMVVLVVSVLFCSASTAKHAQGPSSE